MRKTSTFGWTLGIIALALVLGGGLGWWLSTTAPPPPPLPSKSDLSHAVSPTNQSAAALAEAKPSAESTENPDEPGMATPPEPPSYEDKLEQILLGDGDEKKKAQSLLDLIYTTPAEEAKVELSQHLINMVMDDNYGGTAELLTNAATSAEVSRVLMNDLLNRNNGLKLPMLLAIARNDDHPLKGEAKEMLELFIQEDKGTNWADWETAIQAWLKENEPPPEPAAADLGSPPVPQQ